MEPHEIISALEAPAEDRRPVFWALEERERAEDLATALTLAETAHTRQLLAAPDRKFAVVAMKGQIDGQATEAKWECDLTGPHIQPKWSADELQQKMQSLMRPYSVWRREHCHTAQERLRRELRILR